MCPPNNKINMKNLGDNILNKMTKSPNKEFAVIGLGRFGLSVCETLYNYGAQVLAVDIDLKKVNLAVVDKIASHVVQADVTEPSALKELGIREVDVAIVALGTHMEESVVAVLTLKEIGVQHVIAKASSKVHEKLLKKVGADLVVFPEHEMGAELARGLVKPKLQDWFELDGEHSIAEISVPEPFVGKTLAETYMRSQHGLSVLALRIDDHYKVNPAANTVLSGGWSMIVIGENKKIDDLAAM